MNTKYIKENIIISVDGKYVACRKMSEHLGLKLGRGGGVSFLRQNMQISEMIDNTPDAIIYEHFGDARGIKPAFVRLDIACAFLYLRSMSICASSASRAKELYDYLATTYNIVVDTDKLVTHDEKKRIIASSELRRKILEMKKTSRIETIAHELNISASTVNRHLRDAKNLGEI